MSWQTIVKKNGLAVAEVYLSEITHNFRIEAEFYTAKTSSKGRVRGEDIIAFSQYGTSNELNESNLGYPILRLNEFELFFAGQPAKYCDLLSEDEFNSLKLKKGDALICRTNGNPKYVGKAALVMEDVDYGFASYLFRINTNDKIRPATLVAYLNSQIGRQEIEKYSIVSNQANFSPAKFREITIPLFTKDFEDKVEEIFNLSWTAHQTAKQKYSEAKQMLFKEINLEGYKGTEEATSIRNFSEALTDNRFDAEYWQPDYDVILNTLSKYKKGVSTIGDEFKQLKGNFKAEKDKEYKYVEIGDVNVSTGEVEHNSIIGAELPANAKIKFGKRQLITSKVRPNRGATAILDNHEGYIGSGAFTVLTEQGNINLETLMVYLKAQPIRELLLRYNTGTSYPVITDSDVMDLPIPLIDKTLQKKISDLVSVSAKERREAKELLEKAKRAIEIFIEQSEQNALHYLRQQ